MKSTTGGQQVTCEDMPWPPQQICHKKIFQLESKVIMCSNFCKNNYNQKYYTQRHYSEKKSEYRPPRQIKENSRYRPALQNMFIKCEVDNQ